MDANLSQGVWGKYRRLKFPLEINGSTLEEEELGLTQKEAN
jgi:hypothetical protein